MVLLWQEMLSLHQPWFYFSGWKPGKVSWLRCDQSSHHLFLPDSFDLPAKQDPPSWNLLSPPQGWRSQMSHQERQPNDTEVVGQPYEREIA
jgi:hypothetical protein